MVHIETNPMHKKKPGFIIADCYGTPIKSGASVAFNYCGAVRKGTIEWTTTYWKAGRPGVDGTVWWNLKFILAVKNEDGKISNIKNPNSFIIIN